MSFLPDNYKEPKASRYMKPGEGEIRFRTLGKHAEGTFIMGHELWVTNPDDPKKRKPLRFRPGQEIPVDLIEFNPQKGEPEKIQFFWMFLVWNYDENRIEIMQINQSGVRAGIKALTENPKWGDPSGYDIVVKQQENNGKITYLVTPDPKEPLSKEQKDALAKHKINLEAIFEDGDPFTWGFEKGEINIDDVVIPE